MTMHDATVNDMTRSQKTPTMQHEITPIPVRPWTLNGLSERLIVSR